jgi:hypothetical protein
MKTSAFTAILFLQKKHLSKKLPSSPIGFSVTILLLLSAAAAEAPPIRYIELTGNWLSMLVSPKVEGRMILIRFADIVVV